jgi:hypothetical protein
MAAVTVEVVVSTAAVALMAAITGEDRPTAAIEAVDERVPLTVAAAGTEARHRRAVPAREELGPRRAEVLLVILRRDGIRLDDQATAGA